MKVGVIGAGAISDIYISNMLHRFDGLEVIAVAAAHPESAKKKADQYGLQACTVDELLAMPEIEMIVNLTPVGRHYELVHRALEAGKHVYTEKTLADDPAKAAALVAEAKEKGLYLGCAPDTFLGASLQTARKAIDGGLIGEVTSFSATVNRDADVLNSLFYFLHEPGAGVALDYAVYYVTAIVSLLGPVAETAAYVRTPFPKRANIMLSSPDYGKMMDTPNESILSAMLKLEDGVTGTIHIDEESVFQEQVHMVIYGTEGMVFLPKADYFGGQVKLIRNRIPDSFTPDEKVEILELPYANEYHENSRGIGPAELAAAIREGRESRVDAGMACHVLDVLDAILRSGREHAFVGVSSTCRIPEAYY